MRSGVHAAPERGFDTGLGALQISAPELISEDDLGVVREWLRPGMSAAVIAYEHSWARRLARAVRDAGGMVMISRSAGRGAGKRQAVAEAEAAVREAAKARLLAS